MKLAFTEIWAAYQVTAPFRNPFHSGSLWRGVLGRAIRRAGCTTAEGCQQRCIVPGQCLYSRFFDPPMPEELPHRLLRGATQPPQPPGGRALEPGNTIRLGVRVFGTLTEGDAARLHEALAGVADFSLGSDAGRLSFVTLETTAPSEMEVPERLFDDGQSPATLHLVFETPAWLERQGELDRGLNFPALFVHIYRRLKTLCALYGSFGTEDDARLAPLRAQAESVRTVERHLQPMHWERLSTESGKRHPMHGLIGRASFSGSLAPFLPILRMAEVAHIGKSTSFGLGRIRVEM